MAMAKKLEGAGLRGQIAGKTALSTVGKTGSGLTYRGYDIKDLAGHCQFEEVAYLILKGHLPNGAASSTSVPRSGPWDNEPAEPRTPTRAPAREPRRTASTTERVITNVASSAARSIGTQIGRAIFRSILGSMTKR